MIISVAYANEFYAREIFENLVVGLLDKNWSNPKAPLDFSFYSCNLFS